VSARKVASPSARTCARMRATSRSSSTARAWSGVSVASFVKQMTVQELSEAGLRAIGPCAVTLARTERLDAHAEAVALRLRRTEGVA